MSSSGPLQEADSSEDNEDGSPGEKQRKNFVWDDILLYMSSLGLTLALLGIAEEAFVDRSLACNTPLYVNRDQLSYVLLWCSRHVRHLEELPLLILFQSLCIWAPHVIWEVYSSPAFTEFFSTALRVGQLRAKATGFYDDDTMRIIRKLKDKYTGTNFVRISYVVKLLVQAVASAVFLAVLLGLYQGGRLFDKDLLCPDIGKGDTSIANVSRGIGNMTVWCTYSASKSLLPLWVANIALLIVGFLASLVGIAWLHKSHSNELHCTGRSDRYYSLGINYGIYDPSRIRGSETKIRSDLDLLMLLLFSLDQGQGEAFRDLIVEVYLQERWTKDYEEHTVYLARQELLRIPLGERLKLLRAEVQENINTTKEGTGVDHSKNLCMLGQDLLLVCLKGLKGREREFNCALHIYAGSKGCTLAMAKISRQTFAIDFNQFYNPNLYVRTSTEVKVVEELYSTTPDRAITVLRVPVNVTNTISTYTEKFFKKMRLQPQGQGQLNRFDLIVISCLEPHFRIRTLIVMIKNVFYMCTTNGCFIVICANSLEMIEKVMDHLQVYCDNFNLKESDTVRDSRLLCCQTVAEFLCSGESVKVYLHAATFSKDKYWDDTQQV